MIRNVILAIILLSQCAIWFVLDNPFSTENTKSETVAKHQLDDVPISDVERIEVAASTATLRLSKKEGVWCVENTFGYPAIQENVQKALTEIQPLSKSEFRNAKPFLHRDLEVDEQRGTKIRLFGKGGKLIEDLVIGKRDVANSGGTFVRRRNEDAVFVTRAKNLESAFSVVPRNWIDLGVWDFPSADQQRVTDLKLGAHRVEVEGYERETSQNRGNRQRFRFVMEFVPRDLKTKREESWKVVEPADKSDLELSDLMVRSMVTSMLNMKTQEVLSNGTRPEYKLDDPDEVEVRVTVHFKDNGLATTRTMEIGARRAISPLSTNRSQTYYLKVRHPGGRLKQNFVHAVAASYLAVMQRGPESYVDHRREKARKDAEEKLRLKKEAEKNK
ncbi:MAG: hypothetical protein ACI97A_002572 [Planctomycetota bacterium]|jgi:hypothetical protein